MPASLLSQSRFVRLPGGIPALLAHPDWTTPRPVVLWMHGRTVTKEIDPGRYLRWIRSGIAACAIDLPGHGERRDESLQSPSSTLDVVEQGLAEIDHVVEALADPGLEGVFDLDRVGIGGMSAGGMIALRRCCEPHEFRCVAVESTAGDFSRMHHERYFTPEQIERLSPILHLDGWRPIDMLALHSEADEWVEVGAIRSFVEAVRARHGALGAADREVTLKTWERTGAPAEHAGFGKVSAEAKDIQRDFYSRHLIERALP
jgi:dienelactone hydrolase